MTTLFVFFRTFMNYFRYKIQFLFTLKKTTGKSENSHLKVPSRTDLLSKMLFTLKLLLDSFCLKKCIQTRKKRFIIMLKPMHSSLRAESEM